MRRQRRRVNSRWGGGNGGAGSRRLRRGGAAACVWCQIDDGGCDVGVCIWEYIGVQERTIGCAEAEVEVEDENQAEQVSKQASRQRAGSVQACKSNHRKNFSTTYSAMPIEAVRPGLSMPRRLTKPSRPASTSLRMTKSWNAVLSGPASLGRIPL